MDDYIVKNRDGMPCDGWAVSDRPIFYLYHSKQEVSCKSCVEKTLDAFRSEEGRSALMEALGRTCRYCMLYDPETEDNYESGICVLHGCQMLGYRDYCSQWADNNGKLEKL